jgi:hypothetical protein
VQCGICFDSYAACDMVAAYLPPEAASSSSSTGRCSHLFCAGCMTGYVQEKVQVCRGAQDRRTGRAYFVSHNPSPPPQVIRSTTWRHLRH